MNQMPDIDTAPTGTSLPAPALPAPSLPSPSMPAPGASTTFAPDPSTSSPSTSVPTLPTPTLPTLPTVAPVAPVAPEPQTFDAAALVESQRVGNQNPAYGVLPTATDAARDAANELRAQAQKKRRRNRRIGQMFVVAMLAGLGAIGFLVVRAFQDGQVEETADTGTTGGVVSATPTGEQDAINEVIGELNGQSPGESGGLTGAIDDARDLTQAPAPGTVPISDGSSLPAPRVANLPDFRSIGYTVRVYDGAHAGANFRDFDVIYDTLTDDYAGPVFNSSTGAAELVAFNDEWRYSVGLDGVERRVRRSEFSRGIEPDTALARLLTESDVFPSGARPFATVMTEFEADDVGYDGTPLTAYGYFIDVAAFRQAEPESYAAWRTLWATAPHDIVDLIEPGTEQVRRGESVMDTSELQNLELEDWSDVEVAPVGNQASLVFVISEKGMVHLVALVSPDDDLRVVYQLTGYDDQAARLPFPEDGWVDAP